MEHRPDKMSLMDINKMFSLLQPRDDEEDSGESEELSRAVCEDDHETLDRLLSQDRYKRLINRRSGWGVPSTPLRLAATWGCVRSLRVLLEAGASPLGSVYNNCSPLLLAARDGHVDILRQLLEPGAEANVQARLPEWAANSVACSGPLYLAAAYGHLECFRLLLLHGADPDYNCTEPGVLAQIREPKTLLETCLRHGCHSDFIRLLIDFGANVYLPNLPRDGAAPRSEGLELLLQARAHPKSLLSQSRLAMRRLLKQPGRPAALGELEIPTVLAKYLQHQP
ncbi:PREDICTED: ankyrin repeat and SOCS box protein 12 [Corvus brachyrhynchos]|uniref:ankyrin repeat and SOCS box protein 12 n=1 Tax=Corvus brachyrhynchos TaxID=85066 RepID=UPI0004DDF7EF|nr:PREDICTED: ankyrin repeat and SOCS box protein 12 [Corvus brachyrhynchos]XP_017593071.1 PREDICTED: ankyrin repeat and SOCS box protein 12 [Corvus brachyrhynchos]